MSILYLLFMAILGFFCKDTFSVEMRQVWLLVTVSVFTLSYCIETASVRKGGKKDE